MEKEGYTREEYDKLMKALKPEGYEEMSIAAFNSFINKALTEDEKEGTACIICLNRWLLT